jgi:hypothetical protein
MLFKRRAGDAGVLREAVHDQDRTLDATLAVAQTQILAQVTDEASPDGRNMGLLAFNASRVRAKAIRLQVALSILTGGLVIAALLITLA